MTRRRDLLLVLALEGYAGLQGVWASPDQTVRDVRLAGRHAVIVRGESGARLFYDTVLFSRDHAVPDVVANPLFGRGAVHGLDDLEHDQRKAVFLAALDRESVELLVTLVERRWRSLLASRVDAELDVHAAAVQVLGESALDWCGAAVSPRRLRSWCRDLATMVDGFGSAGLQDAVRRRQARRRCESWARAAVRAARLVGPTARPTPVELLARATQPDGSPLDERTAAVELLNLVRPTVAVAWFVAFAALTLADRPDLRAGLASDTGSLAAREAFAHELRRARPFVPVLAARARHRVDWQGHHLRAGERLVLDVWGTHHLAERWPDPDAFRPERFREQLHTAYDFVPQGGGVPAAGHRCPGEPATVRIIEVCVQALADLSFRVVGDRTYPVDVMPTRPPDGVRIVVEDEGLPAGFATGQPG